VKVIKKLGAGLVFLSTLILSGCFSVEINAPAQVNQNTVFTVEAVPKDNEGEVTYQWVIDGAVVSDAAIYHTLMTKLGDVNVSLTAVDAAGNEDAQSTVIKVVPQTSLNDNFTFEVTVADKVGYALENVSVNVNGIQAATDANGVARFEGISQTELMIVSAQAEGYLTQTYQYTFDAAQEFAAATLVLQAVNPARHVVDATQAISIEETELHTRLELPANSFVTASGAPVTGNVSIAITPIDIRTVGTAFLGGAQALTNQGETVVLISAGMADYQFSANGEPVYLANGVAAVIEMDLATNLGDDGRVYAAGDTIEMWWFDTEKGLWIEDGVGVIETAASSPSGLKLVATVHHFTTWNWDYYKADDRSALVINCTKAGAAMDAGESCRVVARSASITREMAVGPEGVTAINVPPSVEFKYQATLSATDSVWVGSLVQTTQSGTNIVTIDLQPTTSEEGSVLCKVINATSTDLVGCDVIIDGANTRELNTDEFADKTGTFKYISGEQLVITAYVEGGAAKTVYVDTSAVAGDLAVELLFQLETGTIECTATLDGANQEGIPCPSLVEIVDETRIFVDANAFSGSPLRATFSYDTDSLMMQIALTSDVSGSAIRAYGSNYYFIGEPIWYDIDLSLGVPAVRHNFEVTSDTLYSVRCEDALGQSVDCDVTLYSPREDIIYQGLVSELSNPNRLPTWLIGKVHLDDAASGFGWASLPDTELYSSEYQIVEDQATGEKTVLFLLEEMPH